MTEASESITLTCYVTFTLMTLVERLSNGRRIEVES